MLHDFSSNFIFSSSHFHAAVVQVQFGKERKGKRIRKGKIGGVLNFVISIITSVFRHTDIFFRVSCILVLYPGTVDSVCMYQLHPHQISSKIEGVH